MKIRPMALIIAAACTALGGCGGGGGSNVGAPQSYTVGGTVSGLLGGETLQLLNNGTDTVSVAANGAFTFPTALAAGAPYAITVSQQPTAANCTVSQGSGTASAAVTNVAVACTPAPVKRIALFLDSVTGNLMNYLYDPSTAALAPLALPEATAGAGPTAVTIDTSASRAFTLSFDKSSGSPIATLAGFNIGAGGLITPINSQALGAQQGLASALDMAGDAIYVLQSGAGTAATTLTAFPIDPTTGTIGTAGTSVTLPSAVSTVMARNPAADFLYVLDPSIGQVVAYNIGTNITSIIGMTISTVIATGKDPVALAFTPNGQYLYVLNAYDNTVSIFSTSSSQAKLTAVATPAISPAGTASQNLSSILVDPSGQFLYIYDAANNAIDQYSINQSTGELTPLSPATIPTTFSGSSAVKMSTAGTTTTGVLYAAVGNALYSWTINPSNGQLTAGRPPQLTLPGTAINAMAFGQ